jgi:hypothetical protein
VTISLQGFKTQEIETTLNAGSSNSLNTKLEVGQVTEVVNVTSGTDLVRTDTPTVTQTVSANFIQTLPRSDRNALNFLVFLPGVTTVGGAAGARFNTTIAGLPNNQFNITIDGITNSNLLQATDGFFSLVVPRLDAVEEVSLTTASAGADASGQGAIQVRFVTRSGTNKFEISVYEFMQHKAFNSNTFFNRLNALPVPAATNHTYGGRVGGPIILPGFDGRGRAFFFFNQEEVYGPIETARNRTIIRQSALNGDFTYGTVQPFTTRNVLAIAAANGQVSAYDPIVKKLLEDIRAAAATTGTISEVDASPNTASYAWLVPNKTIRHTPTTNITVNLTPKNRLQGSYYWQRFNNTPDTLNGADPTFPGFPAFGDQSSYRTTASISLRSTLSTSIVNEVRTGWAWAPVGFFVNTGPEMFDNQGGYNLSLGFGLSGAASGNANGPEERNTPNVTVSESLNWLKGSHAFTFGADYTHLTNWLTDWNHVPSLTLGYQTNFDPAEGMFNTTNFPGSTSGDRNSAKALYALLTGRVSSIGGTGRLNEAGTEYVYNGPITGREWQDDYSFFAQDVWRWKPTVTITAGVRYQYTLPMNPANSVFTTITLSDACGASGIGQGASADGVKDRFCNMFQPGTFGNPTAPAPSYNLYTKENKGYNTDYNNLGPIIGMAWRPNVQDGWLRKILGDPELATINGGFTRSFVRTRLDQFLTVYDGNPGQTIAATRSTSATAFPIVPAFAGDTAGWPILYTQRDRLGPPAFNPNPQFPLFPNVISGSGSTGICTTCSSSSWNFNPDISVPYTDSWNVSLQRAVTKDTVFEVRYQGNRGYGAWTTENWNATNIYETGWLNGEFEKAQANLRANVLAGRGGTMKYFGPNSGTSPLPITLAHLNASLDANNPAAYVGNVWTSSTFTGVLDEYFPNPGNFAANLYGGSFNTSGLAPGMQGRIFLNAMAAGYPANYWQLNPQLPGVNVVTNSANRPMNHLVTLQVRRRLAAGLAAQVGYTWQRNVTGSRLDFHLPLMYLESNGVPHAIQALWSYDIPFGRGKRYGANVNAWVDGIAGGWTFSGTARFQTQSFNIRNAVLVGMTNAEAQEALKTLRFVTSSTGAVQVFNFPEDIYTNTRLAYNTDETQPTYYVPGQEPYGPAAMPTADGTYRYFAPAGGPGCNFIYTGDCGTQNIRFLGRWFGEMDFRLAKAFQLPGKARFEFSAEIFNATKAINFANAVTPGTGANTFATGNGQSGARTAQLVWRVTW